MQREGMSRVSVFEGGRRKRDGGVFRARLAATIGNASATMGEMTIGGQGHRGHGEWDGAGRT